jgi:membrane-associated phospholipid phosphatase
VSDSTRTTTARDTAAAGPIPAPVERVLLYGAAVAVYGIYLVTGRVMFGAAAKSMATPLDAAIPFVPAWEWFYFAIYVTVFVPLFQIRDVRALRRAVLGFAVAQIAANVVFCVLPVRMVRPEAALDPHASFTRWGLGLNYLLDPPMNCFPSLHVGNAFYAAFVARRVDRPVGRFMVALAVAIAFSTLFTKQHYALDCAGGLVLGWLCYRTCFASHVAEDGHAAGILFPRKLLLVVPGAFVAMVAVLYWLYRSGMTYQWPTPYAS